MIRHYTYGEILRADSFYRRNLIHCLSDTISLNFIGTCDKAGKTSLTPFSQVFHLTANPPTLGILFRPPTVIRHTLENILETGLFTLNHVSSQYYKEAPNASSGCEESESRTVDIRAIILEGFQAPFVAESPLKLGCKLIESQLFQLNQTVLVTGSIEHIYVDDKGLRPDGTLDLTLLDTVTSSGVDKYNVGKNILDWTIQGL